jgi:hypothetical protein
MKTLKEFLDDARQSFASPQAEKYSPQTLSPIHFSAQFPGEAAAYKAAFEEFLKYYGKDSRRADHFGSMLHDALVKRNTAMLHMWYNIHKN